MGDAVVVRALRTGALVLAAVVALASCSASAAPRRDRSTLVLLERGDADTLDPFLSNQYYALLYEGQFLFDTLLNVNAKWQPIPWLATSWKITGGGKVWTLQLRRGVRWSDGAPFTSADVVWTYDALLDPKTGSPYQGQFPYIKKVVALGPYAVRFLLSEPNASFITFGLGWSIMPAHKFVGVSHAAIRTNPFGEHPVGTGPYELERWNHDQELVFTANPYWWGGKQSVRRIDVRVVQDPEAEIDAMLDGTADMMDGITDQRDVERMDRDPSLYAVEMPDLFTRFMYVNEHRPGLGDAVVRRAMEYGWDRKGVADGLRDGAATLASSIWPAALGIWHDFAVKPYPYDPAKARAILDADGWRVGPDGIRRKDGVRLSYGLLLPTGASDAEVAAEFQADMRTIGIAINAHMLDYATFITETNESKFDIAYAGWGGAVEPDETTMLASNQTPPNGNNYGFYDNPAVDRDLRLALRTTDVAVRKRYYDDIQVRMARDVPVLFGTDEKYITELSRRVHVVGPLLPDSYFFYDVAHWRLDP